ncbi:MAG: helix-turn-helix domain-containing protein [Dehalococcoidia bacterium]|nr:helix-turn-helix domain-containing protein [Dehalococcoidia bacterium]
MDRLALTVPEVANSLGVSKSWVYDSIARRRLPAVKLSPGRGAVRVRPQDLRKFLEERRVIA